MKNRLEISHLGGYLTNIDVLHLIEIVQTIPYNLSHRLALSHCVYRGLTVYKLHVMRLITGTICTITLSISRILGKMLTSDMLYATVLKEISNNLLIC